MRKLSNSTRYFNPTGQDDSLLVGNPTGITDFNSPTLQFSNDGYKLIQSITWFVSEVSLNDEAKSFKLITDSEREVFKLVFANLNFLDSSQADHIIDFRSNLSHKITKAALTLQAMQEDLHCEAYAAVLTELGNSDEVMNMYKTEPILMERNTRVAELFSRHINGRSSDTMLGSAMANIMLEGVLFLTSFGYVFNMGNAMKGTAQMVGFIARDEVIAHTALFASIFKTLRKQNKVSHKAIEDCYKMMDDAVQIELDFAKYVTDKYIIQGMSFDLLRDTVYNFANDRLTAIGLDKIYPERPTTRLQKLVHQYSTEVNSIKSNFFESKPRNYSKDTLDLDDF